MDTVSIKVWLIKNKITQTQIARELGIIPQTVWKTIHKREKNRKVLAWLKQHGALKEDMVHEKAGI